MIGRLRPRWSAAALLVAVALVAGGHHAAGQYQKGKNQCYRRLTDPVYACSGCADNCLGDGYRCCTVVADPVPDATPS